MPPPPVRNTLTTNGNARPVPLRLRLERAPLPRRCIGNFTVPPVGHDSRARCGSPGPGTTVLVNGLGLMPVWYYGTEEQKERFIGTATADTSGEFIVGYAASEPPGTPGGTANFDAPAIEGAGMHVTARLEGDEYVIN